MTTRCRHDLHGALNRVQGALTRWREAQALVQETWVDETAKKFFSENVSEVESNMTRMISSLHEATELVRTFEKRLVDTYEESF